MLSLGHLYPLSAYYENIVSSSFSQDFIQYYSISCPMLVSSVCLVSVHFESSVSSVLVQF